MENSLQNSLIFLTNRTATFSSEVGACRWILPRAVTTDLGEELLLGLSHLSLPISWHVINRLNNVLEFNSNGVTQTFTLAIQDHSPSTLVQTLNTLDSTLQFTLNSSSGILSISAPANSTISGSILSTIGIDTSILTFPASGQVTTERMDLSSGLHAVYISADIHTRSIDTRSTAGTKCLQAIPVTADYGALLTFFTDRPIMFETSERVLTSIEIRLETSTGKLLPLAATSNWEITLAVMKRKNNSLNKQQELKPENDTQSIGSETDTTNEETRPEGNITVSSSGAKSDERRITTSTASAGTSTSEIFGEIK